MLLERIERVSALAKQALCAGGDTSNKEGETRN